MTDIAIIGVDAISIIVTVIVLGVSTFIISEQMHNYQITVDYSSISVNYIPANASRAFRHLIIVWSFAFALITIDSVNAFGVLVTVVEVFSQAFVDDCKVIQ